MPQLIPFTFLIEISWAYLILSICYILYSIYILPNIKSKMIGRYKLLIKKI